MPKIRLELEMPNNCKDCAWSEIDKEDLGWCNLFHQELEVDENNKIEKCCSCLHAEIKSPQSTGQEPKEYCECPEGKILRLKLNGMNVIDKKLFKKAKLLLHADFKFCPFCSKPIKEVK